MLRLIATILASAFLGGGSLVACSCMRLSVPGPCGNLSGTPTAGRLTFVGTVSSAEHAGVLGLDSTDLSPLATYHFRVDELISATEAVANVDIVSTRGGGDCSAHFKVGVQYLIYASRAKDGTWTTNICSGNRLATEAALFLQQLRAQKKGYKLPSLYGVLLRTDHWQESVRLDEYTRPLAGVRLRLKDEKGQFETTTDQSGQYLFYDVPGGKYKINADLPPGLELENPASVETVDRGCRENRITTLPGARIVGHVLNDSGTPVDRARVTLYREELYGKSLDGHPWSESQQGAKPFVFQHVAPGKYILVFNEENDNNPDAPYGRTFYGGVDKVSESGRVVVSEADAVVTADIHVSGGAQTRKVRVKVVGSDGQPYANSYLTLAPGAGFPSHQGDSVYTINLLKGKSYEVTANSYCLIRGGQLSRAKVSARIDDDSKSEWTLVMPGEPCPKEKPREVK